MSDPSGPNRVARGTVATTATERTKRRRKRLFQFSLRTVLAAFLVVGVALGLVPRWHDRAMRQRRAVRIIAERSAMDSVTYEGYRDPEFKCSPDPRMVARRPWFRSLLQRRRCGPGERD